MADAAGGAGAAGAAGNNGAAGGAAGAGGNPGGGAGGAAGGNDPGGNPNAWMLGFSEDHKSFVGNKGFKNATDILDSYRNLEKLVGVPQDRLLKLPENMDGPDGRAIFEKLGAPKDAKEYGIETPKGADPKSIEAFTQAFLKAGATKSQAKAIMAELTAFQTAADTARVEAAKLAFSNGDLTLKKDWGAAFEQNTNMAKEAAKVLGVTEAQVNAMGAALGHDGTMKLFHKLAGAVRESDFIGGRAPGAGILAPDQAKAEIKALIKDAEFAKKLSSGDFEAKAKWNRLHEQAFQGEMSL